MRIREEGLIFILRPVRRSRPLARPESQEEILEPLYHPAGGTASAYGEPHALLPRWRPRTDAHPVEGAQYENHRNRQEHGGNDAGGAWAVADMLTASSTARSPNRVVNLITGFMATEEVSLKGSPTVSPTTVAACSGVPFSFRSTSTIFFALSHAAPALAMKMAWKRPNRAMEMR